MLTYSINVGTITEAKSLQDLNSALNQIPDNTTHLIKPSDLRDALLTNWTSTTFKPTSISASSVEYIGIDSSPSGVSLKEKIFLGKRKLLNSDVMDDDLLNSDTDIFIYNTKIDALSQDNTKISILAGTSSSLYKNAPYIESAYVVGLTESYLDLNLKSETGNINIISSGKYVSVNGAIFPTIDQTQAASDGYVLKKLTQGGDTYLDWQPIETAIINTVYSSGTVSIGGSPVLINGNPTDYTNLNPTLAESGGIPLGSTFSRVSFVDMFNQLLYPYTPPSVSMTFGFSSSNPIYTNCGSGFGTNNLLIERNTPLLTFTYNYNIVSKSYPIISITSDPGGLNRPLLNRLVGTGSLTTAPINNFIWTLTATDGTQSSSATVSLTYIYPYFWGLTTSQINFDGPNPLARLNKIFSLQSNQTVLLNGQGVKAYFLYPSTYGDLTSIIDSSTGYEYITSFTKIYNSKSLTSSTPPWSTTYKIYEYTSGFGYADFNSNLIFKH